VIPALIALGYILIMAALLYRLSMLKAEGIAQQRKIDRVRKVTIENASVYPEAMSLIENALSDRREIQ
jgi:hypothetical protein